ncbi:beta-3-deoxy-D-manno-oct-2-ulosonic acid transferase [Sandarakinorhabdus sp. AAP62]|uniref:capsular polysaccharide export protein, LipB/KpsS family n=1 Tax=Sandarakinorhabdus sp. AAP62 TaxID=1248916 RepID=UPI0002FE47CE|nr:beta-3-deoxy-D-manno-oct-2-ulosonic acid transferase [Sandarakinorhabdus sp. AAP62]
MAPLLAIPPFPGARPPAFAVPGGAGNDDPEELLAALARHRVGGCYWGRQVASPAVLDAANWPADADPWTLLDNASEVRLPADDPRALLAMAAGKLYDGDATSLLKAHLTGWQWRDPFNGNIISPLQAIELCGFWRLLIDGNRHISAALGFAYWKRPTVSPLMWNGQKTPFRRGVPALATGDGVAIWRSRLSAAQAKALADWPVLEVEDGFIRSAGLGADCVPPLSIIVDRLGAHFDPSQPSELENLLQNNDFPDNLLARAQALRTAIVAAGLSKYEKGEASPLPRPGGTRRHILVPGQVEDDRAVTSGGALSSNLELLRRARTETGPNAYVIYKPHPDVLAGHRKGLIAAADMAALADRVETAAPMADLIAMVDELHVNSSLAGFEALLRGKPVTVHGVPFYAGWGLTTDRGPVPARRTARRSLDELVAAAYLLYPRYLDPETGLPCPAEVLVQRLTAAPPALDAAASAVVAVRRATGRVRRLLGR